MFEKITENVENISLLSDTPAMPTNQLKKEFDKGNKVIKEAFNKLIDNLNKNLYPIGFRMFINSDADYSNYLGFTWQKVAKGRVLVGKSEEDKEFDTLGKTGGKKTHTLSVDEIPSHTHGISLVGIGNGSYGYNVTSLPIGCSQSEKTDSIGRDAPHNNLQPYEVVNIWERIA